MHCEFCNKEIIKSNAETYNIDYTFCDVCDANLVIDHHNDEVSYWHYYYEVNGKKYFVSSSRIDNVSSVSKGQGSYNFYEDILELDYFIDKPNTLEEFKVLFDNLLKLTLYK